MVIRSYDYKERHKVNYLDEDTLYGLGIINYFEYRKMKKQESYKYIRRQLKRDALARNLHYINAKIQSKVFESLKK